MFFVFLKNDFFSLNFPSSRIPSLGACCVSQRSKWCWLLFLVHVFLFWFWSWLWPCPGIGWLSYCAHLFCVSFCLFWSNVPNVSPNILCSSEHEFSVCYYLTHACIIVFVKGYFLCAIRALLVGFALIKHTPSPLHTFTNCIWHKGKNLSLISFQTQAPFLSSQNISKMNSENKLNP